MGVNMNHVRLMIADDEPLVRAGLRATLGGRSGIIVVAEAANGEEAVRMYRSANPDVVIMDTSMPIMDGFQATSVICGTTGRRGARIIIHASSDCDEQLFRALRSGALGFVPKDGSPDYLIKSIHQVRVGEAALSIRAVTRLVAEFSCALFPPSDSCLESLSPRERDVLKLVLKGLRSDEIAERLTLSRSTAKSHLRSICHKLNVRDRAELIIVAYRTCPQQLVSARS
jgi:DNA-binding NarL/FixJ family response regulator